MVLMGGLGTRSRLCLLPGSRAGGFALYGGVYWCSATGASRDAYIAMIPKADGNATPLGQRVLPVIFRLWASRGLTHLKDWVKGWVLESVFSLGNGVSSVEAWFSTALDTE